MRSIWRCIYKMNGIDYSLLSFVNHYSHVSWLFDKTMLFFSNNHLVKAGLLMFALWYFWFLPDADQENTRRKLTATVIAGFTGLFLARALAALLPFRMRPIHEQSVHFLMPFGMDEQSLHGWSSFPSDHAVLFFSLSAGIYFIAKGWGIVLLLYTALFVAFPRLYLGLHYPSDLVFGMVLGVLNTWLMCRYFAHGKIVGAVVSFAQTKPQYFYPLFALLCFQITEMFDSVRMLVGAFFKSLLH